MQGTLCRVCARIYILIAKCVYLAKTPKNEMYHLTQIIMALLSKFILVQEGSPQTPALSTAI